MQPAIYSETQEALSCGAPFSQLALAQRLKVLAGKVLHWSRFGFIFAVEFACFSHRLLQPDPRRAASKFVVKYMFKYKREKQ